MIGITFGMKPGLSWGCVIVTDVSLVLITETLFEFHPFVRRVFVPLSEVMENTGEPMNGDNAENDDTLEFETKDVENHPSVLPLNVLPNYYLERYNKNQKLYSNMIHITSLPVICQCH